MKVFIENQWKLECSIDIFNIGLYTCPTVDFHITILGFSLVFESEDE